MNRSVQMLTLAILLAAGILSLALFTSPASATRNAIADPSEIGSIDVFELVDIGIMTEPRTSARDVYSAEGDAALTPLYQQDAALQNQLNNMDPNDPAGGQLYQQYQANLNQLQQMTQQINAGYQQLIANQIAELYKEIYAATNEIAAENAYTYVIASRANSDLVQTDSIQGVTQEILARPLVTPPSATDLTEMVRVKLGFPTRAEVEAAQEAKKQAEADAAEAAKEQVQQVTDEALKELNDATTDAVEVQP